MPTAPPALSVLGQAEHRPGPSSLSVWLLLTCEPPSSQETQADPAQALQEAACLSGRLLAFRLLSPFLTSPGKVTSCPGYLLLPRFPQESNHLMSSQDLPLQPDTSWPQVLATASPGSNGTSGAASWE